MHFILFLYRREQTFHPLTKSDILKPLPRSEPGSDNPSPILQTEEKSLSAPPRNASACGHYNAGEKIYHY